jgi:hypothetical protein
MSKKCDDSWCRKIRPSVAQLYGVPHRFFTSIYQCIKKKFRTTLVLQKKNIFVFKIANRPKRQKNDILVTRLGGARTRRARRGLAGQGGARWGRLGGA